MNVLINGNVPQVYDIKHQNLTKEAIHHSQSTTYVLMIIGYWKGYLHFRNDLSLIS